MFINPQWRLSIDEARELAEQAAIDSAEAERVAMLSKAERDAEAECVAMEPSACAAHQETFSETYSAVVDATRSDCCRDGCPTCGCCSCVTCDFEFDCEDCNCQKEEKN